MQLYLIATRFTLCFMLLFTDRLQNVTPHTVKENSSVERGGGARLVVKVDFVPSLGIMHGGPARHTDALVLSSQQRVVIIASSFLIYLSHQVLEASVFSIGDRRSFCRQANKALKSGIHLEYTIGTALRHV